MEEIKLRQFEEKLLLFGYAKATIRESLAIMRMFCTYLEDSENITSFNRLLPEHIKAWQVRQTFEKFPRAGDRSGKHALARGTLTCRMAALRTFFRIMHNERLLPYDYSGYVVLPKRRKALPRNIPSTEQMRQIIQTAVPDNPLGIRDRFLLELLYATGIRSTEVRTLTIGDLNVQERTLYIRNGKGGRQRLVPLGEWVIPYALEHVHTARPFLVRLTKTDLLFPTRNGRRIDASMLHKIVNHYGRKAGLDMKLSPHLFRHACATHMIQAGADIRYVQELLGHSDLSTTQIYTRVTIGDLKKAHAKYHPANRENF